MKQFLVFGLLVLIQVNFITCKYYQTLDDDGGDYFDDDEYKDNQDDWSELDDDDLDEGYEIDDSQSWNNEPAPTSKLYPQYNVPEDWAEDDDDDNDLEDDDNDLEDDDKDLDEVDESESQLDSQSDNVPVADEQQYKSKSYSQYNKYNVPVAPKKYYRQDYNLQNFIRRRRSLSLRLPGGGAPRVKRQDHWYISVCTRSECSRRGDGWRALEKCGPAFCTCQNGNAYLQGCAIGLIYHAEKRLCTWHYNVPGC